MSRAASIYNVQQGMSKDEVRTVKHKRRNITMCPRPMCITSVAAGGEVDGTEAVPPLEGPLPRGPHQRPLLQMRPYQNVVTHIDLGERFPHNCPMKMVVSFVGVLVGLALVGACATKSTPRHVAAWESIRLGMSQDDVRATLGPPDAVIGRNPEFVGGTNGTLTIKDGESDSNVTSKIAVEMLMGVIFREVCGELYSPYDRWVYGNKSRASVSRKAFVVYFDADSKVIKYERPIEGPYAHPETGDR